MKPFKSRSGPSSRTRKPTSKPAPSRPGRPSRPEANPGPDAPPVRFAPPAEIARAAARVAAAADRAAFVDRRRPEPVVASAMRALRGFSLPERLFISGSVDALLRWHGWIGPLRLGPIEAKLLIALLLDRAEVHPACRALASEVKVDPRGLLAMGGAPSWPRLADAFRRLVENPRATTEPWLLFPRWFKDEVLEPPGIGPIKHRHAALLLALQRPPRLWLRATVARPAKVWAELNEQGIAFQVHRTRPMTAAVDPETPLQAIEAVRRGDLVAQGLASQAIVNACDADPGERWLYAGRTRADRVVHLASRMAGKGTLTVAALEDRQRIAAARSIRGGPHSNVAPRHWDGRRLLGKAETAHGVLLEPPCSESGAWHRSPGARWSLDRAGFGRIVEEQARLLRVAAEGVRHEGTLIYAVGSLARSETTDQVARFLDEHPGFRLDPFPDPIERSPTDGTWVLWPDRDGSDGAFVARLLRVDRGAGPRAVPPAPDPNGPGSTPAVGASDGEPEGPPGATDA